MFQREKDLVLIPRNEYETLVRIKQKGISQVSLTRKQERAIAQSRRELAKGEFLTFNELAAYVAHSHTKTRR